MTRVDVVTRTLPPNEVSEANPWDTDRFWTVPNVLSVIRLIGVPIFLWLALGPRADGWAVSVLAVAGLTDWLSDRLYIFATVIALTLRDVIPLWLVIVLIARDVCMACLMPALRTRGFTSLPVHFVGKAATFCLLYSFPLVLLGRFGTGGWTACRVLGWAFAVWGTGLYWWAFFLYLVQTIRIVRTLPRISSRGEYS